MNDDELLRGLRGAALRADEAPTPSALDAPLGPEFEARVAAQILAERAPKASAPKRGRVLWLAAPLAAAAAIALWIARPTSPTTAPLPEYAMEITGGVDTERGAPSASTDVSAHPGDTLTFVLRPATDVALPVEAHLLAMDGGPPRDVPVEKRVSASGSVELRARVDDLAPHAGDVSSTIVVGRPGVDAVAMSAPNATIKNDVRVFHLHVHVAPTAP
jgi:hypothetical protein